MKKRLFRFLFFLVLALGMLALTAPIAKATTAKIWVGGQEMSAGDTISCGSGTASFDGTKLTLDNFSYDGYGYDCRWFYVKT